MKVAIVGYGIEGKVSARYWAAKGGEITVCDRNEALDIPEGFQKRLGSDYLKNLHEFDVIVRTAGLHPRIIAENNPEHPEVMDRVTTSLNEFLESCPSKQIIGVTGTKGKGTTSTLITKILEAAGLPVHLGGNIGKAPLEMLTKIKPEDYVVLELSSFQLIDLKKSVPTAVCLMVVPEHLNWHADTEEYTDAKSNLFKLQNPSDKTIFNRLSPLSVATAAQSPAQKESYEVPPEGDDPSAREGAYVAGDKVYYGSTEVLSLNEIAMIGRHNLENICAAIAATWPVINGNVEPIRNVVSSFTGLKHHLEYVNEIDGVKYYDDSYSTMPDAAIAAIDALKEPKVLILGGGSKGLLLDGMIKAVANSNVRHVVLQGSMAREIQKMLETAGFTKFSHSENTMEAIVAEARKYAEPGDAVLLSPGLPAKGDGYFIDNVDRGNQFKQVVNSLDKAWNGQVQPGIKGKARNA